MLEREPNAQHIFVEAWSFFVKIFIPAFVAISVKVATQVKREKMSVFRVLTSFVIGIGCAYFFYPFTRDHIEAEYIPVVVGMISISGDKIAEYLIYKLHVEQFVAAVINSITSGLGPKKDQ